MVAMISVIIVAYYLIRRKSRTTNVAFIFIKPHACTDATKALVKAELQKRGITIVTEGGILGSVIGASIEP